MFYNWHLFSEICWPLNPAPVHRGMWQLGGMFIELRPFFKCGLHMDLYCMSQCTPKYIENCHFWLKNEPFCSIRRSFSFQNVKIEFEKQFRNEEFGGRMASPILIMYIGCSEHQRGDDDLERPHILKCDTRIESTWEMCKDNLHSLQMTIDVLRWVWWWSSDDGDDKKRGQKCQKEKTSHTISLPLKVCVSERESEREGVRGRESWF